MGQFHSIDITVGSTFTISKDYWEEDIQNILNEGTKLVAKEHVIVVVMQFGLANVCLVGSEETLVISHIEHNIPKKKQSSVARDKAIISFYSQINDVILKQLLKFNYNSVVVIGR